MTDEDDEPIVSEGPLYVVLQTTQIVCQAPEGYCKWIKRSWTHDQAERHCTAPAIVGDGYIPSDATPKWCDYYPERPRPPRRSVRPVPTKERKAELAAELFRVFDAEQALHAKTNVELADLLVEHVWGDLNMFGSHSILIGEAIERLRKASSE